MAHELPPISGEHQSKKPPKPDNDSAKALRKQVSELSVYTVEDLITLRAKIDNALPPMSLKSLNMERELVIQLRVVKALQDEVINDDDTPANQRAQVANAVAATLATLGKLQVELFDSERLKQLEQVLIDAIKELPVASQETFMSGYERLLKETLSA